MPPDQTEPGERHDADLRQPQFELYTAFFRTDPPDSTGALFGIFFVGGCIWGGYQTWNDNRDKLAAFEVDEAAGTAVATLWRPFTSLKLAGPLEQFTRWRFKVQVASRGVRSYHFFFRALGYPREIQMEIPRGTRLAEVLRRIAPVAVADYEDNTGTGPDAASDQPTPDQPTKVS
ncbi:MAG: hypothetical protein J0H63_13680 [Rhizobiales bacterium]|nr:hypothetical protein [Hyphomicrobiales bacterium]